MEPCRVFVYHTICKCKSTVCLFKLNPELLDRIFILPPYQELNEQEKQSIYQRSAQISAVSIVAFERDRHLKPA